MKRQLWILLFIISKVSAQELTQIQKDSLLSILDQISLDDQKYRNQLMYGELDPHKLDSLVKLPFNESKRDRIKKAQAGELIEFNSQQRDSIWQLQLELDSINFLKFITFDDTA